ncbi:50S ribosomal protein L4 [Candidatus Protofrankia californiensis]|uniref:Large ribosomal subunit protein uL4 n=1 Tax=Candidatus Protofrankia californiensis TaxID=1839754 RepID=A0A1C3PFL0_9ACTN|nr:50S ribosomal protein L4 [Candidatus Protofrankia californiensis]
MSAVTASARRRSRGVGDDDQSAPPQTRTVVVHAPVGGEAGSVELPGGIFDVAVNVPLIHQVVVAQLAAARQGTHSTLTRGEVRGGGRKPYRQKGTGRARQGSLRAPQFTGGGIVHGPKPRSYDQRTPKKMKVAALRGALSDRARNQRVHVVSSLLIGDTPSTKAALTALRTITDTRRVLVVAARNDELTWKSLRNVPAVHLLDPGQLNTYDVLVSDDVVFTRSALAAFLDRSQAQASRGRGVRPATAATDAPEVSGAQAPAGSDDDAEAEEEAK